jgi:hypothetical protein
MRPREGGTRGTCPQPTFIVFHCHCSSRMTPYTFRFAPPAPGIRPSASPVEIPRRQARPLILRPMHSRLHSPSPHMRSPPTPSHLPLCSPRLRLCLRSPCPRLPRTCWHHTPAPPFTQPAHASATHALTLFIYAAPRARVSVYTAHARTSVYAARARICHTRVGTTHACTSLHATRGRTCPPHTCLRFHLHSPPCPRLRLCSPRTCLRLHSPCPRSCLHSHRPRLRVSDGLLFFVSSYITHPYRRFISLYYVAYSINDKSLIVKHLTY